MHEALTYGLLVLVVSGGALLAVQSHTLTKRLPIPAPAFFLVTAALVARLVPDFEDPTHQTVERVVTLALIVILFEGGMSIGLSRLRLAAGSVASLGVLGTFVTVAATSVLVHGLLGVSWYLAVLVATAVSPTDPAVVFSVLGQNEIEGTSGTVLEGESGANDPVGIALMAALISAGSLSGGAVADVAGTFVLQMVVGAVIGIVGGKLLTSLAQRALPSDGLYSLRVLVFAGVLFGVATVLHGSGFLAVFVAGIMLGDQGVPHKAEIERFHASLASLGEIVAFAMLGFTVNLAVLGRSDVWIPGLVLGLLLAVIIRPLVVAPMMMRSPMRRGEKLFVLFSGLKGAVPLLLGSMLLPLEQGERLYGVVVIVVLVSVLGQGTSVPFIARRLGITMRSIDPDPLVRRSER